MIGHALGLFLLIFAAASFNAAIAQEPPLFLTAANPLAKPADALSLGEWVLFPVLGVYTLYDSNLYSTTPPVVAAGFRILPTLRAQWTNGIHSTEVYGQIESRIYPSVSKSNTFDRQAGIIQKYEMLRDLIFTANADYTHQTNAPVLRGAIPGAVVVPGSAQASSAVGAAQAPTVLNPFDQLTGSASVQKIFNRGIMTLSASISKTDYADQSLDPNFNVKTLAGNGGFWVGPMLYVYADGSGAFTSFTTGSTTSAYTIRAGIGSTKIGLFQTSLYAGQQWTNQQIAAGTVSGLGTTSDIGTAGASGTAGGLIFGGKLSYYPTPFWTLGVSADETQNISHIASSTCTLALSSSTTSTTPLPVSSCASVWINALAFSTDVKITRRWSAYARFDYERIKFLVTPEVDFAWVASAGMQYEIDKNTIVTLDYQHSRSTSAGPFGSWNRDYGAIGATHRF